MDRAWTSSLHQLPAQIPQPIKHSLEDTYLKTKLLSAGEVVELQFDLPEREVTQQVGHLQAKIKYRGNEVVQFEPSGRDNPYWVHKRVELPISPEVAGSYFLPDLRYEPLEVHNESLVNPHNVTVP